MYSDAENLRLNSENSFRLGSEKPAADDDGYDVFEFYFRH